MIGCAGVADCTGYMNCCTCIYCSYSAVLPHPSHTRCVTSNAGLRKKSVVPGSSSLEQKLRHATGAPDLFGQSDVVVKHVLEVRGRGEGEGEGEGGSEGEAQAGQQRHEAMQWAAWQTGSSIGVIPSVSPPLPNVLGP